MLISQTSLLKKLINKGGLTILEVLMAMVLVSLVLMALSGFATVAIKGSSFGKKLTTAVTLAQDTMEEMRGSGVGYQPFLSGEVVNNDPYGTIPGAPQYERTVSIQGNSPAMGMQTVTVTVSWDSDRHSTSISTIFAE